jgi:hypothetical protein
MDAIFKLKNPSIPGIEGFLFFGFFAGQLLFIGARKYAGRVDHSSFP